MRVTLTFMGLNFQPSQYLPTVSMWGATAVSVYCPISHCTHTAITHIIIVLEQRTLTPYTLEFT